MDDKNDKRIITTSYEIFKEIHFLERPTLGACLEAFQNVVKEYGGDAILDTGSYDEFYADVSREETDEECAKRLEAEEKARVEREVAAAKQKAENVKWQHNYDIDSRDRLKRQLVEVEARIAEREKAAEKLNR